MANATHLVQLLLPLYDNEGNRISAKAFAQVRDELVQRFGGMTAHTRAPASGLWQPDDAAQTVHDELVIFEVMVDGIDTGWWTRYRTELEKRFRQQSLVVRAHPIATL
jgi:hypothetical protein